MPVSCHHTMPSTVVEGAASLFEQKEENHARRISAIRVRDAKIQRQSKTRQLAQIDIYKAYSNTNYDLQTRIQKRLEAIVLTHYKSGKSRLIVENGFEGVSRISIRRRTDRKYRTRGKKSQAQLAALRNKRLLRNNNKGRVGKNGIGNKTITSNASFTLSQISEEIDENVNTEPESDNNSVASLDHSKLGFYKILRLRSPEEIQNIQRRSSFQHTALVTQAKMARLHQERERERLLENAEILEKKKHRKKRLQAKRQKVTV